MSLKFVFIRFFAAVSITLLGTWLAQLLPQVPADSELYERLAARRPPVRVAHDLVLIDVPSDAGQAMPDAFDWAEIILLMTEFEAGQGAFLFSPAEVPPSDHGRTLKQEALNTRFDQEFSVMSSNVLAFFEAIRLGAVRPKDSVRYVDDLIRLIEGGKSRLIEDVRQIDVTDTVLVNQALAAFGKAWIDPSQTRDGFPDDSYLPLHSLGTRWSPAVFQALLARLGVREPDFRADSLVLPGARLNGGEALDIVIPLGQGGSLFFEAPRGEGDGGFRRLKAESVARPAELESELYKRLKAMEGAGYFSELDPETYPTALYEHFLTLQAELLADPDTGRQDAWRLGRSRFYEATRDFLGGEAEKQLLSGYDNLVANEILDEPGRQRIQQLRQLVVEAFSESRNLVAELEVLRNKLDAELRGSLCIIGPETETKAEAELVNAIMVSRFIDSLWGQRLNRWIALPGLIVGVILVFTGPLLSLVLGILASAACFGVVAAVFLYSGLWIHPFLPAGMVVVATLSSILASLALRHWHLDSLRRAFGFRLPSALLGRLAWAGPNPASEVQNTTAAILAIRYIHPEEHGRPEEDPGRAVALKDFQDQATRAIVAQGGVLVGTDGFIVLAAFGSPLEAQRSWWGHKDPAEPAYQLADMARRACAATLAIMGPETATDRLWRFGLDLGECAFFHSEAGGYSAVGRPPVYARLLSGLALKYSCRILVTQELADAVGEQWVTRRLDTLVSKSSGREEAFYELSGQPWH